MSKIKYFLIPSFASKFSLLKALFLITILAFYSVNIFAQDYGNEWIDYSKTYYKIPVTHFTSLPTTNHPNNNNDPADYNGLRRITYATLQGLNLHTQPAEHFQLWRNGAEVPLYITKQTGLLGANDYIEFWGESNDGKIEKQLYRNATDQKSERWSLYNDTAWYYLTINESSTNARLTDVANPTTSSLTPEPYFMHTVRINHRAGRALGTAFIVEGKSIYSSSYDNGEGFNTGSFIAGGLNMKIALKPLHAYKPGPAMKFRTAILGDRNYSRTINANLLNQSQNTIGNLRIVRYGLADSSWTNVPVSILAGTGSRDTIQYTNSPGADANDLVRFLYTELQYPHNLDFDSSAAFRFDLPAYTGTKLFHITANIKNAAFTPYLLDLSNNERFVANNVGPNIYSFELPGKSIGRKLVFMGGNTLNTNYKEIALTSIIQPIHFNNYRGSKVNYIIISNKRLYNSNGENFVDQYKQYRNSTAGGSFNADVYDIDSLSEQFSYGVRKSPLAIRNFVRYMQANSGTPVKYVLLIGKGVLYNEYNTANQSTPQLEGLNLVPTWGIPASDNMLVAAKDNQTSTPLVPIGRLNVVNGTEVGDYLQKVKQYELLQNQPNGIAWQKNVLHMIGGSDASIFQYLKTSMQDFKTTIENPLAGSTVQTYSRGSGSNTAADNASVQALVSKGLGLASYFGHSSSTGLDFNLNDPYELGNTAGKYPFFLVNGCLAADFFTNQSDRFTGGRLTLSEKFTLAKERGSIGFLSSSTYGIMQILYLVTREWYKSAATTQYGKGLGDIQQDALTNLFNNFGTIDFYIRTTAEQYILHGDPAVKLFSQEKADYEIDSTSIVISPNKPTVATDSLTITVNVRNNGKAIQDSVDLELYRYLPNGLVRTLLKKKIAAPKNNSIVSIKVPVAGSSEKGLNYFRAVVDSANIIDEYVETNNAFTTSILIEDVEITPVIPYQYSIVNNGHLPIVFKGSSANPIADSVTYLFQIDSTITYSSPLFRQIDVKSTGGTVEFKPNLNNLIDSTVYYWRISPVTNGIPVNWQSSSFIYLAASGNGYNQSHYYQHLQSTFNKIKLTEEKRQFVYDSSANNLYIDHGIAPTSGTEDAHFSITINGDNTLMQSVCVSRSICFNVFDSLNFQPWGNPTGYRFGSGPSCGPTKRYNFEFPYYLVSERKKMMDFLDSIPKGMFVAARLVLDPEPNTGSFPDGKTDSSYSKYWQRDTAIWGSGKSLYHSLYNQGFYDLDKLDKPRTFAFVFKKDDTISFKPKYQFSNGLYDRVTMNVDLPMQDTGGIITSPPFGPASEWQQLHWRAKALPGDDGSSDSVNIKVIGVDVTGKETVLKTFGKAVKDTSIADIDAAKYPYIKLQMVNNDPRKGTPNQLDYWRLNYEPIPEGAIAPASYFNFTVDESTGKYKDTLDSGIDSLILGVAFKNISYSNFKDSVAVEVKLVDSAGVTVPVRFSKLKPLIPEDTVHIDLRGLTDTLDGSYNLLVNFNPNRLQPEETLSNNFMYKSFFVDASPEGAADSLSYFNFTRDEFTNKIKDTLVGSVDTLKFGIAFKNISIKPFKDSIDAAITIQPDGGLAQTLPLIRLKPLSATGDTLRLNFDSITTFMPRGWYTITATFNPGKIQREKRLENNSFSHRYFIYSIILPVELNQFTATPLATSVKLDWNCNNDVNVLQYIVEYSTNGTQFNELATVNARQETGTAAYNLVHTQPVNGMNYYRIKVVDKQGDFKYSGTRQVYFGQQFRVQALPNPFKHKLNIYLTSPGNTDQTIARLIDAQGRMIKQVVLQSFTEINTSALAAGSYWLVVENGKEKVQIKLEKL